MTAMSSSTNTTSFGSIFGKIWQQLINFLDAQNELKIWQKRDRGNIYWKVYNPKNGQFAYFASENEVRIWIEQQLYKA
jgi:hypothetical protein